jgi:glycogen debranching enzyme
MPMFLWGCLCNSQSPTLSKIYQRFQGKYGQLEIGGKYAGAEFHNSRPLPSRISFYYPVANSIDLSTNYWERHKSIPLELIIKSDQISDTLSRGSFEYRYVPFSAIFSNTTARYQIEISYDFCDNLPALALGIRLKNLSSSSQTYEVIFSLNPTLRTSHTYQIRDQGEISFARSGSVAFVRFDEADTDSALLFIINDEELPVVNQPDSKRNSYPQSRERLVSFDYRKHAEVNGELAITILIGTCQQSEETEIIDRVLKSWKSDIQKSKKRILNYAYSKAGFDLPDTTLTETLLWSRMILASNHHYIDEHFLPMPCPAEYNFFFTHDALVAGLGAVYFDTDWMKQSLLFLHSITLADSILPHAYYWKDGSYKTEYCGSDNWNHFWFIISSASYFRHSGDHETMRIILPSLQKSLAMTLEHKGGDDLMYASRPDWWDIGNVYGARVYHTSLMIRALKDYVYIVSQLDMSDKTDSEYLGLAERMKVQLTEKLWDAERGFLMNPLDKDHSDHHYYSGSLIAAWLSLLNDSLHNELLKTARRELLDENLGIRNAMPPDFHKMGSVYKFNEEEMGDPYYYFNGGVWPQGIIWYSLGLIAAKKPDNAMENIKKYLTLAGIKRSSCGQPSFYEYRFSDPNSPDYGMIDKPTFLWAAGWYVYALYHLFGVRENSANISFSPNLPEGFHEVSYHITLAGKLCHVQWTGTGIYFKEIRMNGKTSYSAIPESGVESVMLKRGKPTAPYLADSNCKIESVFYSSEENTLLVECEGIPSQKAEFKLISPFRLKSVLIDRQKTSPKVKSVSDNGIHIYTILFELRGSQTSFRLFFAA